MKYFISIATVIALSLISLPANSQIHPSYASQTSQQSDEWALKIDNLIQLYSLEPTREYITVEDVNDYTLEDLFKLSISLFLTTATGDQDAIFEHYLQKATRKQDVRENIRHVKLASIFKIANAITYRSESSLSYQLKPYTKDEDLFVAFVAHNIQLTYIIGYYGANISAAGQYFDEYNQIRTLIPSPNHYLYNYYRYLDSEISAHIKSYGGDLKSALEAFQEAEFFAQKLGLNSRSYFKIHQLLLSHSRLYSDDNSRDLSRKLVNATQHDPEHHASAAYVSTRISILNKNFKQAVEQLKPMAKSKKKVVVESYHIINARAHLYSGEIAEAEASLAEYFKSIEATEKYMEQHPYTAHLNILKQVEPDVRQAVNDIIFRKSAQTRFMNFSAWKNISNSYVHSLGIPNNNEKNTVLTLGDKPLKALSVDSKNQLEKTIQLLKTPNILAEKNDSSNLNYAEIIIKQIENNPNTSTHYLQNSNYYDALANYDYGAALIFHQPTYIKVDTPDLLAETQKNQTDIIQLNLFETLHYLYGNDPQSAWQLMAKIDADIAILNTDAAELEYQVEYVKFLLFTAEHNLHLALQAANNHITKAIDLKRQIHEASILENLIYLLYQNKHYGEALGLMDTNMDTGENRRANAGNREFLKAALLTETDQNAAALAHAQFYDSQSYSVENQALFQSLKYLNQASLGDVQNAKITKQTLSNLLAHISNRGVQNIAQLNIARAQGKLQNETSDVQNDYARTIASTIERNRQSQIIRWRTHREKANLGKESRLKSSLLSQRDSVKKHQTAKTLAYLATSIFSIIAMIFAFICFKHSRSLTKKTMLLGQKQEEAQKVYDYLSTTSSERVKAIRRNLNILKDNHIDEGTISSLTVAINEADTLLADIKRTKIRSRLATSLNTTASSVFDPHNFRRNMLPIWMQKLKSKNVTLTINCSPKLMAFETDAEILTAVIDEVVMKAVNATLFGSIAIEFNVSKKLSNHILSVIITDTGDASQCYDEDDITTQAVSALDGSINHHCEPGDGCTVKMTFPIKMKLPHVKPAQNSNVISLKP